MNMVNLSILKDYATLEDALKDIFQCSKNRLIKSGIDKKSLIKSVKSQDLINIPINLCNHGMIKSASDCNLEIIQVASPFLAINKPVNLNCHPLQYDETDNVLSNLATQDYDQYINLNLDNYDRGLLYRLDYSTSGVLILTNDFATYNYFRENFNSIVKEKIYLAIVSKSDLPEDSLQTHYFQAAGVGNKIIKVSSEKNKKNQEGKLELEVLQDNEKYYLLKIKLFNGLRHQIRAQLSYLNLPILGDELYGGEKSDRLYLHAWKYKFEYNEKEYAFEANANKLFDFFDSDSSV